MIVTYGPAQITAVGMAHARTLHRIKCRAVNAKQVGLVIHATQRVPMDALGTAHVLPTSRDPPGANATMAGVLMIAASNALRVVPATEYALPMRNVIVQ